MTFKLQLTEAAFQAQVEQLARFHGWHLLHIQKALNDRGYWRTPITGDLGKGWPDLVMVKDDRLLFVELKANGRHPTQEQKDVLGLLSHVGECYVWHPDQWEEIAARLTNA